MSAADGFKISLIAEGYGNSSFIPLLLKRSFKATIISNNGLLAGEKSWCVNSYIALFIVSSTRVTKYGSQRSTLLLISTPLQAPKALIVPFAFFVQRSKEKVSTYIYRSSPCSVEPIIKHTLLNSFNISAYIMTYQHITHYVRKITYVIN